MTRTRTSPLWRSVSLSLVVVLQAGAAPAAQEHLVDRATRDLRLLADLNDRARDTVRITAFLNRPETVAAAKSVGIDARQLSHSVAALTDKELHELALRTDALVTDPVAGMGRTGWIVIAVLIVVSLVWALATGGCTAGCS